MAKPQGRTKQHILFHYTIDGTEIPVEISRERRRNVRISCGVDKLYLRIPLYCSRDETLKFVDWGRDWAEKTWSKHAWFRERFTPRMYSDGQEIETTFNTFILQLTPSARPNMRGKIIEGNINIQYPGMFMNEDEDTQKDLHQLIHKLLGKFYYGLVSDKVSRLNAAHFNRKVSGLRLSYQHTRWGSCSSQGRISLSTRLLFAPEDVLDYVIIHELAHLIEHNHSTKFWSLVAGAMPGYQIQEKWLKSHGHLCD